MTEEGGFDENDQNWQCFCGCHIKSALRIVSAFMGFACVLFVITVTPAGFAIAVIGPLCCMSAVYGTAKYNFKFVVPFMFLTVSQNNF